MHENRIGTFIIKKKLLSKWKYFDEFFKNFVVITARYAFSNEAVLYLAYSKYFQVVDKSIKTEIPLYSIYLEFNKEDISYKGKYDLKVTDCYDVIHKLPRNIITLEQYIENQK